MKTGLIILCCLLQISGKAQDVEMSASVSSKNITTDDVIRLEVRYNKRGKYTHPEFNDFHASGGQVFSSGSQMMINGRMVENNMTYIHVYNLKPKRSGNLTVESAKLVVDGKTYTTPAIQLEVAKGTDPIYSDNEFDPNKKLIAHVSATRTNLYEGENLTLVYKMYSPYQFHRLLDLKIPTYTGFWKNSLQDNKNRSYNVTSETVNGRRYNVVILEKELLIPKSPGTYKIGAFDVETAITDGWQTIRASASSVPITVTVRPLPEQSKPEDFTGAVGKYSITAELSRDKITAGDDGVDLKITVSGTGNIEFIDDPKVDLPEEFDLYPPETDKTVRTTPAGQKGEITYNYFIVPLANGDFDIGPFNFSYFNPETNSYKTISTEPLKLQIDKPDLHEKLIANPNNKLTVSSVRELRYIKSGPDPILKPTFLVSSPIFWTGIGTPALLFLFLLVWKRRNKNESEEEKFTKRAKAASKIARNRLQSGKTLLNDGKESEFYIENLRALYGYLSEKLRMKVHEMSKSRIQEVLAENGVSEPMINRYTKLIGDCELARYGATSQDAVLLYDESIAVIEQLENEISKS